MSTKAQTLEVSVDVPDGVDANMDGHMLTVRGPLGRAHKNFRKIPVDIDVGSGSITVRALGKRKRDYAIMNTARSLIRNLCQGVVSGYTIKMKIVYAHFPVTVKTKGGRVLVENFQGEHAPRVAKIMGSTKVESAGEDLVLTGHVLTDVSQTAANIQQGTRIKGKDHRVFLDGIYVYEKAQGIA